MFLVAQLCIVFKKIKYVAKQLYLQCRELGAPVEYLIPSCLYEKEPLQLCFIDLAKKGSRISMPKLDHEMFRDYFGGNLWRCDFFSDPARVLSIGRNSDPGFVNPIRSGPGFVNPIRSDPVQVL